MLQLTNKEGEIKLLKDEEEFNFTSGDIYLQYNYNDYVLEKSYGVNDFSTFLDKIISLDYNKSDYYIYYRPFGDSLDSSIVDKDKELIYNNIKNYSVKTLQYSFKFEVDYTREPSGRSDYSYVNFYMPKWSTAFKFYASTHSKLLEPLHTTLKNIPDIFKQILSLSYTDLNKRQSLNFIDYKSNITSEYNYKNLIDTKYKVDSKEILKFGNQENNIYIQHEFYSVNIKLRVKGLYKNQLIEEEVAISSDSIYKLNNKFNMIYDIKLVESEFNLFNKPLIRVANAYNLNNFCYQDNENNLTLSENVLSKNKNIFKINFDYDFLFLDNKDNVYVKKDNILYTSRLDKKIDLNIPQSITYHNTEFIEISSDNIDSFFVTLFLSDYVLYTTQNLISVCFENSKKEKYYLNDKLELVLTDSPIYLSSRLLHKIKTVSLDISLEDSEFILISLEDYDRLYRVDDVITLPTIDLIKELDLSNLDIVTTYNELKDTRKSPTFLKIVLINNKLNAVFKTDEEDLSSSYMVIPLQYEENINKDRVWYSNINTEFLHQFFDIRVIK